MSSQRNLTAGRVRQKKRTRGALLDAAARVIERGDPPRLSTVAAEAGLSRATAYRYFPSERALLLEAPLASAFASAETVLAGLAEASVEERVIAVHRCVFNHALAHEAHFRRFLSAIHEQAAGGRPAREPLRGGRRKRLFEEALAPARGRVDAGTLRSLRDSLVVLSGIDALLVVRDVCGTSPRLGRTRIEWAIRTLVTAALGGA